MEKILCQTDYNGFFIGTTVHTCAGAIDTKEPEFDKETEKAKWNGTEWIIKTIQEWIEIENKILEEQKLIYEKENKKQEILNKLNNIDIQTMRPLRAIQLGVNTIEDTKKLTELEEQAKLLRIELSKL